VLRSIKMDVIKCSSKGGKTTSKPPDNRAERIESEDENTLYNKAMGIYRDFLTKQGIHLDMTGKKAAMNSKSMRDIISYLRGFMKANNKPAEDDNVIDGIRFMFTHWDRLNDYLKGRIGLPQIQTNIEEILLKIRNGADKKSTAKNDLEQFESSLRKGG